MDGIVNGATTGSMEMLLRPRTVPAVPVTSADRVAVTTSLETASASPTSLEKTVIAVLRIIGDSAAATDVMPVIVR